MFLSDSLPGSNLYRLYYRFAFRPTTLSSPVSSFLVLSVYFGPRLSVRGSSRGVDTLDKGPSPRSRSPVPTLCVLEKHGRKVKQYSDL